ncbi:MAG: hypothetical protein ACE5NN_02755, partial [Candidatus Bathyarchaeia archaeon]
LDFCSQPQNQYMGDQACGQLPSKALPLGLILTVLLSQLTAVFLSLPIFLTVGMMLALIAVWLDGISTDLGLKLGLEETNRMIKSLQRLAGYHPGLILSRILPTAVILYSATILQTPHLLIAISSIFLICNINNLTAIIRIQLHRYISLPT